MSRPRARQGLLSQLVVVRAGCSQDQILNELRRVILEGTVAPGTSIPLDGVAELFGVSRIPVREVLKTLVGEDLVEHRLNAGYFVARLTQGELRQLYIVREALETAALRISVGNAGPDDDRRAHDAHAALGAIEDGDSRSHHRESRRFHFALLAPARMQRVLGMVAAAWNVTEPMQPMGRITSAEAALLHSDHQRMLDAFVGRDTAGLLAASAEHHVRLLALLDPVTPGGDGLSPSG